MSELTTEGTEEHGGKIPESSLYLAAFASLRMTISNKR